MLQLLWRNIWYRKTLSILTIVSVAMTVALIVLLILSKAGVEQGAEKGYGPFEVVIGADGSETQLVLNTLYHIGAPTGNIPHAIYEKAQNDQQVDAVYAMTTGDNFNGFPIVGIDAAYFATRYGDKKLAKGGLYKQTGEVVLGSHAASLLHVKIGDTFKGGHGLVDGGDHHEAKHEAGHEEEQDEHSRFIYTVVGILPQLNTADDRAVFTTLDAAWAVHHNEKADHQEVTALLIKPKSLVGAQTVKLQYEKLDNIQAVYSSKVVADVVNMIDKGSQLLSVVTILCILLAAITIVLSLVAAINERKKDVGLLRLIGKSKAFVWGSFIGEGFFITSVGLVLGIIIGHAAGLLGSDVIFDFTGIRMNAMVFQKQELYLILGALVVGIAASAGPAFRIYKVEPLELFRS